MDFSQYVSLVVIWTAIHCVSCQEEPELVMFIGDPGESGRPGSIWRLDLRTLTFAELNITGAIHPLSIDYDFFNSHLYWTESEAITDRKIKKADLNPDLGQITVDLVVTLNASALSSPEGITVDSDTREIFYSDLGNHMIGKIHMDTQLTSIIVHLDIEKPKGITADRKRRNLYWVDQGNIPKIDSSNYNGGNRKTLVTFHVSYPTTIALDRHADRLFWSEDNGAMESILLDGTDRQLIDIQRNIHFLDFSVFNGFIYYTELENTGVNAIAQGKYHPNAAFLSTELLGRPYGIFVFSPNYNLSLHDTCEEGEYGENCTSCGSCYNQEICEYTVGVCLHGCQPGYETVNCLYECYAGTYGQDCVQFCGHCSNVSACHHITGVCPDNCLPGWIGGTCNQSCRNKMFGHGCLQTCGQCLDERPCNFINGTCHNGCNPGWTGQLCREPCDNRTFGLDCSETCGRCRNSDICNFVNGICESGCQPLYAGLGCQECADYFYGDNCLEICGHCLKGHPCNHINGSCMDGCKPGWTGIQCKRLNIAMVTGSSATGVFFCTGVILILVCLFRARKLNDEAMHKHKLYFSESNTRAASMPLHLPWNTDGKNVAHESSEVSEVTSDDDSLESIFKESRDTAVENKQQFGKSCDHTKENKSDNAKGSNSDGVNIKGNNWKTENTKGNNSMTENANGQHVYDNPAFNKFLRM